MSNMAFSSYTPLNKLNPSTIRWTIRVRVQALWKGITRETNEIRGINLILIDDSKYRIHAFVNSRFRKLFESILEEGGIYNISNFIVQDYTPNESSRSVRNEKHIYFADYTKVEKSSTNGLDIPRCEFDFFDLLDLEKIANEKRYLCDVVGVIENSTPLKEYLNEKDEPKKQKNFSVTDGISSVKVTFFDDFAEMFDIALKKKKGEKNIVVISSGNIGWFQGELNIANYPATRFYLNMDHRAVNILRKKAEDERFYKIPEVKQEDKILSMSVREIKKLTTEFIQKKVICRLTVKKVEEHLHWYDSVCTKCHVNMNLKDGRYQCDTCGRHYTWPPRRFRLCVLCYDSTGGLPIILFDREVRRLIGKTVFDVELDMAKEQEGKFPPILKSFVNKRYQITLQISKDNVNNISDVYEACDIQDETDNVKESEDQTHETGDHGTQTQIEMTRVEVGNPATRAFLTKKGRSTKKISHEHTDTADFLETQIDVTTDDMSIPPTSVSLSNKGRVRKNKAVKDANPTEDTTQIDMTSDKFNSPPASILSTKKGRSGKKKSVQHADDADLMDTEIDITLDELSTPPTSGSLSKKGSVTKTKFVHEGDTVALMESQTDIETDLSSPPTSGSLTKKGRVRKTPERFLDASQSFPPNKLKTIKMKKIKSKKVQSNKKKPAGESSTKKKKCQTPTDDEETTGDENIPIKNLQRKKKQVVVSSDSE